jgi:hypothetical protein
MNSPKYAVLNESNIALMKKWQTEGKSALFSVRMLPYQEIFDMLIA